MSTWTTALQNLLNALYTGSTTDPPLYVPTAGQNRSVQTWLSLSAVGSVTAPGVPTVQSWIANANSLTGGAVNYGTLTCGSTVGPDQWGVMSILGCLAAIGPLADFQSFYTGNSGYANGLLAALVRSANAALAAGPPFTGARPSTLRVGDPWN